MKYIVQILNVRPKILFVLTYTRTNNIIHTGRNYNLMSEELKKEEVKDSEVKIDPQSLTD